MYVLHLTNQYISCLLIQLNQIHVVLSLSAKDAVLQLCCPTLNRSVVYMHISVFCALSYVYNIDCISALLICTKLYLPCTDISKLDLYQPFRSVISKIITQCQSVLLSIFVQVFLACFSFQFLSLLCYTCTYHAIHLLH